MHQPSAVGTVLKARIADGGAHIVAKIVDDTAWQKVVEGVHKGFRSAGSAWTLFCRSWATKLPGASPR